MDDLGSGVSNPLLSDSVLMFGGNGVSLTPRLSVSVEIVKRKKVSSGVIISGNSDEKVLKIPQRIRRRRRIIGSGERETVDSIDMTDDSSLPSSVSAKKSKKSAPPSTPAIREMLLDKPSSEISRMALDWLSDIEKIKVKSGRLQGRLSGNMKRTIACLREVIHVFSDRMEATNDPDT